MANSRFFLGSATANGFATPIGELIMDTNNTVYIFKGTAGCGKSTILKKLTEAFKDCPMHIFTCSADPGSLDGVYLEDKKVLVMDGTSPHCYDPVYPKAVQTIIDLGAYLDSAPLRARKAEIIKLTNEYSDKHRRCRHCLSAISSVAEDIIAASGEAIYNEKLNGYIRRTARKLFPQKGLTSKGETGKKHYRQMSAITPEGYKTYLPDDCDIYLVSDDGIAAAARFMEQMSGYALEKGYDVIVSSCMICSEPFCEHIIIPELKSAFISSNCINKLFPENYAKHINMKRFYSSDAYNANPSLKQRQRFGKKAVTELINEAATTLKNAKVIHDGIEQYYIAAADFDSINRLTYRLISEIKGI